MIPFNKPYMTGRELWYIAQAHANGHLSGDGPYTRQCHQWLRENTRASAALLTHSCTAALEMSALLLDLEAGDEVIMPSYTFVSTANAFVLRGAVPVFVDIRADTLNIDERLIEEAITPRTKAICVVHYAGAACDMDPILEIAERHGLKVVEDAAQALMSSYKGRPLGTLGDLGTLSFHETKNIVSGEGGALLCRDAAFAERAEIIREKGTNRSNYRRGAVDKYTWVDIGSSFLPGELVAAFLYAQLEQSGQVNARRIALFQQYEDAFSDLAEAGRVTLPHQPAGTVGNGHMFYLLMRDEADRDRFIETLRADGINAPFHYVPLHSAPAGRTYGRTHNGMSVTDDISARLVRLPMYFSLPEAFDEIVTQARKALS